MTEQEFDNLIKVAGRIAIMNMEKNQENCIEIKFSKRHEKQMKKIFKMAKEKIL